jgi:hypothetical protein
MMICPYSSSMLGSAFRCATDCIMIRSTTAPFPSPRPELTNLLLSQAEEPLESFAPLSEQFGTVHEDRRWRRAFGDEGLHVLQEILGHASIETTRGYLHTDDRHLASAAEQANAFLSRDARPNSSGRPRQGTVREL